MSETTPKTDLDFYEQNGYLVKKGLISADLLALVNSEIDQLHQRMATEIPDGIGVS